MLGQALRISIGNDDDLFCLDEAEVEHTSLGLTFPTNVTVRWTSRVRSTRQIAADVAVRGSSQLGATVFDQTSGSSSSIRDIGQPA